MQQGGRGRGRKRVVLSLPGSSAPAVAAPAPSSDKLGALLRMYSELSTERKARAFDFIAQLHALESPDDSSGPLITTTVVSSMRGRRLGSPPPPNTPGGQSSSSFSSLGRPRPPKVFVPPEPEFPSFPPSVPPGQPAAAALQFAPVEQQTPAAELRVTLTGDQLRRLSETIGAPATTVADPLDGFVSSVFSPSHARASQPPPPQQQQQVQPAFGAPPLSSPLRRQMRHRQPDFNQPTSSGGESVYAMLGGPPPQSAPSWQTASVMAPPPPVVNYAQPPPPVVNYAQPPSPYAVTNYAQPPSPSAYAATYSHPPSYEMAAPPMSRGAPLAANYPAPSPPPFVTHESHEHIRNLYVHPATATTPSAPSPPQEKRPFMQSLTSMHQGMSEVEVAFAERRKAEWLRDLDEQRRAKEQQRAFEKADKEIEDLKEELQLQTLRSGADAALRSAMRAAKPG